jgi:hypothetical protein
MGIVATLISTLYQGVLFGMIDHDFMVQVNDIAIEKSAEVMEAFGVGGDEMERELEKAREANQGFTIKTALQGFGFMAIVGAIGAAIIGAIIKKQNPEEGSF